MNIINTAFYLNINHFFQNQHHHFENIYFDEVKKKKKKITTRTLRNVQNGHVILFINGVN